MAKPILITGATGGLGQALVRAALDAGHAVRATGRDGRVGEGIAAMGAEFIAADLRARDAPARLCDGVGAVIHAAARSASWGARADFTDINMNATRRLLRHARAAGAERFLFISSPSIFAAWADRIGIGPGDAPTDPPLNIYAETKLAAERLVLAADAPGFASAALRPRAIVGSGDRVILPALAAAARRRILPLPRGGRALIELTDVRDAARAALLALGALPGIGGTAVNISGGKAHQVRDVATQLAAALGERPMIVPMPAVVAQPLAALLERRALARGQVQEPLLTRYTLATLGYSQTFDPADAAARIGYHPQHDALASLLAEAERMR